MSNKTVVKCAGIILYMMAVMTFVFTWFWKNTGGMMASLLIFIFANLIYILEEWRNRYVFAFFNLTFFTFLLGKYIFGGFDDLFGNEIYIHIFLCLFISMAGLLLGDVLQKNIGYLHFQKKKADGWWKHTPYLRKSAVLITLFTYVSYMLPMLEKVLYVQTHSYVEYYLQFNTRIPGYLSKWGEGFPIAFWIAMACFPSVRTTKFLTVLYGFSALVSLGTGQRNIFVLNILILALYFIARDQLGIDKKKWISRKLVITCIPVGIAGIIFLSWYAYRRNGMSTDASAFGLLQDFFESQGGTVDLIGYGKVYEKEFPGNKYYSLGPITAFLKNNVITNSFVSFPQYANHTEEMALFGDNFGQTITYLVMPWNYYEGIGMGTCYIAEVYHDFGYLGVLLFNILLGVIMRRFSMKIGKSSPVIMGFYFVMIRQMLYLPRDIGTSFIMSAFNLINIFIVMVILVVAGFLRDCLEVVQTGEPQYE